MAVETVGPKAPFKLEEKEAIDLQEIQEIQDMLEMMRELDGSEGYIYAWEDDREIRDS